LLLGTGRTGRVRPHNFLWRAVQRLSQEAGVSPTCPRRLRVLHTQLAPTARRASAPPAGTGGAPPSGEMAARTHAIDESPPWVRIVDLLGLSLTITQPRLDAVLSVLSPQQFAELRPQLDLHAHL